MKILPYILLIPLVLLALTPPWTVELTCDINSLVWLYGVFVAGFLAFLFLYQKVSVWLRLLVVWCFISCFTSRAPYISFTMYWSLIACAWYYALCLKIDDFAPVKKCVQAIFFFVCLLMVLQSFGLDTLLNFHTKTPAIIGTIGNKMISSSFACALAPFLIVSPLNWIALALVSLISTSSGAVLSIGAGMAVYGWKWRRLRRWIVVLAVLVPIVYAFKTGDIKTFTGKAGRRPVWIKTVELAVKRPQGYGIATYKHIFPVMCGKEIRRQQPDGRVWNTAHNDWLQVLFETGFPGFILLIGWVVSIVLNVLKQKDYLKLAGLAILGTNMMIHFPTRMCMSVLIILMFLAYCVKENKDVSV